MITPEEIWIIILAVLYGLIDFIEDLDDERLKGASRAKKIFAAFSKMTLDVGFALLVFYAATEYNGAMDIRLRVALSVVVAVKLREQAIEEIIKRIKNWKI